MINERAEAGKTEGRLSAYDVGKAVGRGGYSVVYKGTRKADGRTVAIKKVEIFELSAKKRERCLQEVQLLQSLTHPSIISMLDSFVDENELVIVFEWALGGDLKRIIKRQLEQRALMDEAVVWGHFSQVASALRYMHSQRIMHRDVKPANVMVTAAGLKLGDLGLGRHFSEQTIEAFSKVGTPYYVSPEVVKGEGYDWKSDVWSLGCLLYELAALRSPFEMAGANLVAVFKSISTADYAALTVGSHSRPLVMLVGRMLSVDPAARPEIDEVDAEAQRALRHQAHGIGDIFNAAEHIHDQLAFLCSEVKRFKEKFRPAAGLLDPVHRSYFAAPTPAAPPGTQFAVFARTAGWLLLLNGRKSLDVEADLRAVASMSDKRPPAPADATGGDAKAAGGSRQGSRAASRSRDNQGMSVEEHDRLFAPPPAQARRVELAAAILDEAARAGVHTEFLVPASVATGVGWGLCQLLAGLLDCTIAHLKIRSRQAVHTDAQDPMPADAVVNLEEGDFLEGMQINSFTSDLGALLEPSEEKEEEEAYVTASDHERRMRGAHTSTSESTDGLRRSALFPTVDPDSWRREAERVAPSLRQLDVGRAGAAFGGWPSRVDTLGRLKAKYLGEAVVSASALETLHKGLAKDVDALKAREEFINSQMGAVVALYRESRQSLHNMQQKHQRMDDVVNDKTHDLSELADSLARLKEQEEESGAQHDGRRVLGRAKAAIGDLKAELTRMETRIGVCRHQLSKVQLERKMSRH